MSARTLLGTFVALALGVIVFLVVESSTVSKSGVSIGPPKAAAACTKSAPECLPKLTFVDTNGDAYPPDAIAGKVVVINFWATWCKPCQSEIPAFSRVYNKFLGKDVVMLGVMTDSPDSAALLNFESDHELVYPVVRADREINAAFGPPEAIPTTFIYDRGGRLFHIDDSDFIATHRGPMSEDQLTKILYQLSAQQ